ncbi:hypothetical protein JVT61DRAFT_4453 [Boletus reticuloceps]|uniref:Uncharacterized protein n=1 Tax=Boletus reticuloceps TaxID=495285 RepID=A0A8I3A7B1_9AGAM|nr:hypothetical protein JVT61DRAFT_4453 [Boletus reticuloceps]
MPFDPFRRFRLRSHPVSAVPSSTEEDTDDSSPEHGRPHIVLVPAHKNGRKSVSENEKPSRSTTDRLAPSTHIALTLDKTSHPERLAPNKSSKSGVASVSRSTDSLVALQPTPKSKLICCITSKFNISIPSRSGSGNRPSMRTLSGDMGPPAQRPRPPRTTNAVSPPLPNSFVSKQHREAALRERGLLPPRKDLSEQEREADERVGSFPSPAILTIHGSTEAERLKASWLAINRTSESSDSERGPPHLQETRSPPSSVPPPDAGPLRRSGDGKTDQLPTGRPSCCSSVPPLSSASCLEVLHEEPSEQGPFLPSRPLSPAKVPIVISGPPNSPPSPTSPTLVESSVSCTLSSHCPGSTLESHSQSSHPPFHEKENFRSTSSLRRASDRPRRVVGSSMSKFRTHSLTNLRRSIAGSLKSTVSSADLSSSSISQAQRAAIDPTMHSIGSILRAAGGIQDAESRRLSEIAFLD